MGMASARQGMISPLRFSSAMTGSSFVLMQKKYISSTEIRKFGSEFPMKLKKRTTLSRSPSFLTADITDSGSAAMSDTARLPTLKLSV